MFVYSGFALSIHSEIELPDLPPGGPEADVVIRIGVVPRTPRQATMEEEILINRRAGAFRISGGREIVVDPSPDVTIPRCCRFFSASRIMIGLSSATARLAPSPCKRRPDRSEQAVLLPSGPSGFGKSTTAAAFHAHGHHVISDDVAAVRVETGRVETGEECLLRPGGSRIRLLDDSRAVFTGTEPRQTFQWDKYLFDVARGDVSSLIRVERIYLLAYGEELRCEAIPALVAAAELSKNSVLKHERMNHEALAVHLRDCAAVARAVPVYRLLRPRSLHALPALIQSIESEILASKK